MAGCIADDWFVVTFLNMIFFHTFVQFLSLLLPELLLAPPLLLAPCAEPPALALPLLPPEGVVGLHHLDLVLHGAALEGHEAVDGGHLQLDGVPQAGAAGANLVGVVQGGGSLGLVAGQLGLGLGAVVDLGGEGDDGRGGGALLVGLAGGGGRRIQTPPGAQGLVDLLGLGELEVASLLGDGGALVAGLQAGDQLGLEAAGLLGVQVTGLLRHINKRGDGLVMALLGSLLSNTASTADLDRELLTRGVANKLAGLLLNVASSTRGLIHSPALLGTLAITNLLQRPVALSHSLFSSLLLEGNLTTLLKVLLADLLLGSLEGCDIGVVALLNVLVGALQDGVLLKGGHGLLPLHTAEASLGVSLTAREVNSTIDLVVATIKLATSPEPLAGAELICGGQGQCGQQ